MDQDQIELLAAQFLAAVPDYVWDGAQLPVPIDDIADSHLGLLVREADDLRSTPGAPPIPDGQALSGLLLPDRGEIWVNGAEARDWPPRRRFTIAHEIGHWELHRSGEQPAFCRTAAVEAVDAGRPAAIPLTEDEANRFAAAVLMPAELLRNHYAAVRDFEQLKTLFDTSGAAMGRRLHAVVPRSGGTNDRVMRMS